MVNIHKIIITNVLLVIILKLGKILKDIYIAKSCRISLLQWHMTLNRPYISFYELFYINILFVYYTHMLIKYIDICISNYI